ncbi:hypothetical protein IWW38_003641 [Coemansia aciculifera]|uniref:Uncharacterized protein n=1 Tax=Coemansia aciculifera TaxID=417176 RepID=A0ACC1M072_9FUNG|nr:hypothetical protein IWW38_003641 [Coemansia aciculifera]
MYRYIATASSRRRLLASSAWRDCAPMIHTSAARRTSDNGYGGDPRHQEFCKSFLASLKEASSSPIEPLPVDKTVQAIDQQLAAAIKELFAKYDAPAVTPALLERRKQLRSSYPELFAGITDKDLE